jgi:hypothetical protein
MSCTYVSWNRVWHLHICQAKSLQNRSKRIHVGYLQVIHMPNNLHATLFTCVGTLCYGQCWFSGKSGHVQGRGGGVSWKHTTEIFQFIWNKNKELTLSFSFIHWHHRPNTGIFILHIIPFLPAEFENPQPSLSSNQLIPRTSSSCVAISHFGFSTVKRLFINLILNPRFKSVRSSINNNSIL